MSAIVKTITGLIEEELRLAGVELVDVEFEFSKEQQGHVLSVFIDKPGGVNLDDCERISGIIDPILDAADPIEQSYFLCVSSPGLDRPIKKDADFARSVGKRVDIKLYAPINKAKEFSGILRAFSADEIEIEINGEAVRLPRKSVSLARLHIDF